ncbi:hypothetical protein ABGB14_27535 [Nonomuraea sp. B10E15]|uniref:hypothetical protein n=1 Tax=Nonomuraea sp. B10E15 TaxID=3153560 RepID=UPI00325DDFBA
MKILFAIAVPAVALLTIKLITVWTRMSWRSASLLVGGSLAILAVTVFFVVDHDVKRGREMDALVAGHWGSDFISTPKHGVGPSVPVPLKGYLVIDHERELPAYLWEDGTLHEATPPAAADTLVVGVSDSCATHPVTAQETPTRVVLSVTGQRAGDTDSYLVSDVDTLKETCAVDTGVVLSYARLSSPLGDREIIDAATGQPVRRVGG